MSPPLTFAQFILPFLLGFSHAAPVDPLNPDVKADQRAAVVLETRNTQNNPIDATFDVSGWPDIAEENCYVMLCVFNGQRVWHVSQFISISSATTSAEEFPWRSIEWSGDTIAHLLPATPAQQNSQGGSINSGYDSAGVNYGDWFRITFSNYDKSKPYCVALFQNPPDTSVCKRKRTRLFDKSGIDPSDFDYTKVQNSKPVVFEHSKELKRLRD
ncbi:hypothetical protein F4778DRAFT_784013 [Xylariomycetidae sp. FL2044]|nr:hypothetical protein F4778DRAFT_784013 [Xylariomycetidae sp. FL2044]